MFLLWFDFIVSRVPLQQVLSLRLLPIYGQKSEVVLYGLPCELAAPMAVTIKNTMVRKFILFEFLEATL
jgi:hypothetical protein